MINNSLARVSVMLNTTFFYPPTDGIGNSKGVGVGSVGKSSRKFLP